MLKVILSANTVHGRAGRISCCCAYVRLTTLLSHKHIDRTPKIRIPVLLINMKYRDGPYPQRIVHGHFRTVRLVGAMHELKFRNSLDQA
jgi:hypothetical protein